VSAEFRSAEHGAQMRVAVSKIGDDVSIVFAFDATLGHVKRFYVRETPEWPDQIAETLEAAAAEIRRLRKETS